jgi:hypothetical protein
VIFNHAELDVFLEVFPEFVEDVNFFLISALEFAISLSSFGLILRK